MRIITTLACLLLTTPAWAGNFDLNSAVTKATIFGQGASVTRVAAATLPVGQHRLSIPYREGAPTVRFDGTGKIKVLAIGAGGSRLLLPEKSEPILALEAAAVSARQEMRNFEVRIETAIARQTAAKMRLDFLRSLTGKSESDTPLDAAALLAVIELLNSQTIDALGVVSTAKTELEQIRLREAEIKNRLILAQEALDRASPPELRVNILLLDVDVTEAFNGQVITNGLARDDISWQPIYELNLQQAGNQGELTIKRRAVIDFNSDESWRNVELLLSTAPLNNATAIWEPNSMLRGLRDPAPVALLSRKIARDQVSAKSYYAPPPVAEAMEVDSGPIFIGQTVVFALGGGNDLLWNDESKLFELDEITAPVSLYGLAVAGSDQLAFLSTDYTNETGGVILPGAAKLYRNGTLVGNMELPQLNPGSETTLGLGPLLGIQIAQNILNAMDGESGFISSSSETSREMETTITSSLDYPIMVKLLDVVPTSENEDLVITMRTIPRPNETNRNGKRGVLEWALDMEEGTQRTVKFSYKMSWPKDKELTYQ